MRTLHLNLKGEYFDQIKSGLKYQEYRLYNDWWRKRLEGQEYEGIYIKRGYPSKDDLERILFRPWRGYKIQTIKHKHFGDNPVKVFAIVVN